MTKIDRSNVCLVAHSSLIWPLKGA